MIKSVKMVNFDVKRSIKVRGLLEKGKVQRVIDSEVIRRVTPYTPLQTGVLISSATLHTMIGTGQVVQRTPYARKLYYNRQFNFTGAPKRGALWFERMKADQKEDIFRTAEAAAGIR